MQPHHKLSHHTTTVISIQQSTETQPTKIQHSPRLYTLLYLHKCNHIINYHSTQPQSSGTKCTLAPIGWPSTDGSADCLLTQSWLIVGRQSVGQHLAKSLAQYFIAINKNFWEHHIWHGEEPKWFLAWNGSISTLEQRHVGWTNVQCNPDITLLTVCQTYNGFPF